MRTSALLVSSLLLSACSSGASPDAPPPAVPPDDAASPPARGSDAASAPDAIGSAHDPDASAADAPSPDAGKDAGIAEGPFVCNELIGVSVTGDWFNAGFELLVDNAHWQAIYDTHAFVDLWADPANAVWSMAPVSPCTAGARAPDRVIFTGVNWTFTTAQEWVSALTHVVENIKTKYPSVERIDVMTMLRAPNNQSCGNIETVVQPFIDQAIATITANYPLLVTAAPPFFAPSCDVFVNGGPHFTDAGKAAVAKVYGQYYAQHP